MKSITNRKLTPHFKMIEFFPNLYYRNKLNEGGGISEGDFNNLNFTAQNLEKIREFFGGNPIFITSGYRTEEQNVINRGANNSYHLKGLAVDFYVGTLSDVLVFTKLKNSKEFLTQLSVYELIYYPSKGIVHISFQNSNNKKSLKILTK